MKSVIVITSSYRISGKFYMQILGGFYMNKESNETKVINTFCRMCDNHCAMNVYLQNGRIINIDGYSEHPWNKGRLCSKGRAAMDMVYAPDRILKPLKRTSSGWQEIDLDVAMAEISEKLLAIKNEDGARSTGFWKGEAIGFNQQEDYARRFCHAFGTPNYFSNDTVCFCGRYIGFSLASGTWPVGDYTNSKCIILWGTNPPHAHPMATRMIMEAKAQGAVLIVIDPRLTQIARQADIYVPILPGTDGALALGIINLLIKNGSYDHEFISKYTIGFEELSNYAEIFTLDFVEKETGIPKKVVEKIGELIAKNMPAVINYAGNGLEHHENGINNIRAIASIDALCGCLDRKGGKLLTKSPNLNCLTLYEEIPLAHMEPIGAKKYSVLYDYRKECHTLEAMDTILTGKPYPLRSMVITGANPVLTNPNSLKVIEAFSSLDLLVVRDLFMTETAKLAHYVLPAASFLERPEIYTYPLFQILNITEEILSFDQCQSEYEFWHDLAHRLGIGNYFPWKNEVEVNKWLLEPTGITVEELSSHPEGLQYKPFAYCKWQNEPFKTPSGKFEFTSQYLKEKGFNELPEYISPAYLAKPNEDFPFVLITGARKLLFYHSRNHNFERFNNAMPAPELEMHPLDAKKLDISNGDEVEITSAIGSLTVCVKIVHDMEIIPGVLQMTHGWKEANVNMITPDDMNDPIDGFPSIKSISVKVQKV